MSRQCDEKFMVKGRPEKSVSAGFIILLSTTLPTEKRSEGCPISFTRKLFGGFPVGDNLAKRIMIPAEAHFTGLSQN